MTLSNREREGHVPMERGHALDAIRRTQAWFDKQLRLLDEGG